MIKNISVGGIVGFFYYLLFFNEKDLVVVWLSFFNCEGVL